MDTVTAERREPLDVEDAYLPIKTYILYTLIRSHATTLEYICCLLKQTGCTFAYILTDYQSSALAFEGIFMPVCVCHG